MKWFHIRKADIPEHERTTFERFGVFVIGSVLASSFSSNVPELKRVYSDQETAIHAADWLTEQYDRAERRESWLITMEFFVTLFAAAAIIFSILNFFHIA
jgi:hypothetical protein